MSGATVSINKKWDDGTLIQIGGVGFDDFYANLIAIVGAEPADQIVQRIGASVTPGSGGQPAQQQSQPQSQAQQSAPANGPTCAHGARVFKSGTNAAGKAWKGFFCPSTDRSNQCEPQWQR